eukprot:SAG31_NODE_41802_length_274_cov_0.880000_1_plen_38_part_01
MEHLSRMGTSYRFTGELYKETVGLAIYLEMFMLAARCH